MKKLLGLFLTILLLTSCTTTTSLYSWGNYEDASYNYYKKQTPEAAEALLKSYQNIINKQKGSRKVVPPGIYAEYGFMLIQTGKRDEGIINLKKEIELYPESKVFIERIINQAEKWKI